MEKKQAKAALKFLLMAISSLELFYEGKNAMAHWQGLISDWSHIR